VQLSYNAQQLENPLEWAANPGANIARLKSGFQAAVGLGKLANLTQPASWIADPVGNERMVSALWQTAKKNFEADPSKSTGYVAGTIATFFIPGGGEVDVAGDTARAADLGADVSKTTDVARTAEDAGDDPTVWVQHGPGAGPIREYRPGEVSGDPDVGSKVSTPNGDGTVVSRGDPPDKPDVRLATQPDTRPTLEEVVQQTTDDVRKQVDKEISDKGGHRSGQSVGARRNIAIGNRLIQIGNEYISKGMKTLGEMLKAEGRRFIDRGNADKHPGGRR
jgi:hypothetical protein